MTRQELTNSVKTRIDEISPPDGPVSSGMPEDNPADTLIGNLLDECGNEVQLRAPAWRVGAVDIPAVAMGSRDGSGYLPLPAGFLRLIELRMTEWKQSVTEIADAGSGSARKQGNQYLRGGLCKPVCVWARRGDQTVIEYYSVRKRHGIDRFVCLLSGPAENVPADLQDVAAWWCASRVLQIVGKINESKTAYERGGSLL